MDETDDFGGTRPEDLPIRTVGGVLEMYSALPPWLEKLPKDIDRKHYEECEFIIEKLAEFSNRYNCTIEFELDGDSIGEIKYGQLDSSLSEGVLGEWKKILKNQETQY